MKYVLFVLLTCFGVLYLFNQGVDLKRKLTVVEPETFFRSYYVQQPSPVLNVAVKKADPFNQENAQAPKDAPPELIRVGPFQYHVHWRTIQTMPEELGYTSIDTETILLLNSLGKGQMRETLLHEVMHACSDIGHSRDHFKAEDEDAFIESSAPSLLMVMRDNPELVKWMQEK